MTTAVDVQVFGAGPAGLAAALRLHALGYRVAIVERTSFPRFQIGESLTRGAIFFFECVDALARRRHI